MKASPSKLFEDRIAHRSTKIKPLLLNQEYIVGIGNIYVDESLFLAGIHPEREASSLSKKELLLLHEPIIRTLQDSVEVGGSSIKSYVNGQGEIGLVPASIEHLWQTIAALQNMWE